MTQLSNPLRVIMYCINVHCELVARSMGVGTFRQGSERVREVSWGGFSTGFQRRPFIPMETGRACGANRIGKTKRRNPTGLRDRGSGFKPSSG